MASSPERDKIDEFDSQLHDILLERSKLALAINLRKARTSCGFRPGREADISRKRLEQHRGWFPAISLLAIWREIFAASAHTQGDFTIQLAVKPEEKLETLDAVRLHYGFSAHLQWDDAPPQSLSAVTREEAVIAIISQDRFLEQKGLPTGLTIIEKLPFITASPETENLPLFVVAKGTPATDCDLVLAVSEKKQLLSFAPIASCDSVHLYEIPASDYAQLAEAEGVKQVGGFSRPVSLAGLVFADD